MFNKIRGAAQGLPLTASLLAMICTASPATAAEKVLFEDAHLKFVEVTQWPGEKLTTAPLSLPSIIAADAPWPALSPMPGTTKGEGGDARGIPTNSKPYPWCEPQGPQAAHTVNVTGNFPLHYYRMEYKRIDGDGFEANWRTWYASLMKDIPKAGKPAPTMESGSPMSTEWPFPAAYDAVNAAPANHYLRYQDDHVALLEVFIRPGETEEMHGHPFSSVYFDDGGGFYPLIHTKSNNLSANSPSFKGVGLTAPGEKYPTCYSANPQWPHATSNLGTVPQHFYRLQFLRMDGDEIKTQGTKWYPQGKSEQTTALTPAQRQLEAMEKQRTAAIASGDAKTLASLLADDYVHVHGIGRVDNKEGFIKSIVERPRETTRGPLTIRVYGDMAVITGEQVNNSVNADKTVTSTTYMATQVARLIKGHWQLVSMQVTPKTAN